MFLIFSLFYKPFKVVELDKNVGIGIISNELCDELALDSLSDQNIYTEIDSNPLDDCIIKIEEKLGDLLSKKLISNDL